MWPLKLRLGLLEGMLRHPHSKMYEVGRDRLKKGLGQGQAVKE